MGRSWVVVNFVLPVALGVVGVTPVLATNGMNMSGYGPVAYSMGGASLAYDNGSAAVMNNPATLALMAKGRLLQIGLGRLAPDVSANVQTPQQLIEAESSATSFLLPALGWITRAERFTYGVGVYAQGGMGTEFGPSSWLSDPSQGANSALTTGLRNRSEVSVGRLVAPIAYDVNDKLHVGATLDLVWAGLDLQMAMSAAQFEDLANPASQVAGQVSGSLAQSFGAMYEPFGGTGIRQLYHAYFDFSDNIDFTGRAKGVGLGAKIGAVYAATPTLRIGATYHSKTRISDLKTSDAAMQMAVNVDMGLLQTGVPSGQYADVILPLSGKITVIDFQWPATIGVGLSYQATESLQIAADVKQLQWSSAMENFSLAFEADQIPENGGFTGQKLQATLRQNWDDQNVISLGAAYHATEDVVLRVGYNGASNPVPDQFLNALFPAIVESHFSFGGGCRLGENSTIDLSITKGLEKAATNPGNGSTVPPVESIHGQWNAQIMYSRWL